MKKNKTAIILTIATVLLWVAFILIRMLLPHACLSYHTEGWLFAFSVILTSVTVAFWLSAIVRNCKFAIKLTSWVAYVVVSILWFFLAFCTASAQLELLANHYICSNDKQYVMYSNFDATFYGVTLYHRQGIVDTCVCWLDWYFPFDDPILFVYEDADAIVVQHREKGSVYTDVYHFNGDLYKGTAKDSILDVVKVPKNNLLLNR